MSSLTTAQLSTFKAAINADANLAAFRSTGDAYQIALYYNQPSSPVVSIWRPQISIKELNAAVVWSAYAALTVANQNAYMAMTQGGYVDATAANIRNGFSSIFGAGATLTALTALASINSTRLEALFTTSAVTTVFGVRVTDSDVTAALNGP